jgi:hypothetical protein
MNNLPLQTVVELLGVDDSTFRTSNRYKPFVVNAPKGSKDVRFRYDDFMKAEGLKSEARAHIGLFVEYLNKELEISYGDIARFVALHSNLKADSLYKTLWKDDYGFGTAIKVGVVYKRFAPELVNKFDEAYENKQTLEVIRRPKWSIWRK